MMPQFILNTPPDADDFARAVAYGYLKPVKGRRIHPYHALDEFAQAYVEAMFFTNCDSGDENEHRANELGVERLTRTSCESIAADCEEFQRLAEKEIAATLAHGERDLHGIAHDFWFTRQGHGVGFREGESRGYPGSTGDELTRIADKFGEVYPSIYRGWIHCN